MADKNIVLINLNPPYEMKVSSILAASPRTSSILQVLVHETEVVVRDLVTETETRQKLNTESFDRVFQECHTVVLPDSMFTRESFVFETEQFLDNALDALQTFYKKGGNVVVLCVEGVFSVGRLLSNLFGCNWKIGLIESTECEPTDRGREVLGGYLPEAFLNGKAHFMEAPKAEGLYRRKMCTKEDYMKEFEEGNETFRKLGLDPDDDSEGLNFNVYDFEKSWQNYVKRYKNNYCICVHEGSGSEGRLIWYGDRGQNEKLAYVFLKTFNLGATIDQTRDLGTIERQESTLLDEKGYHLDRFLSALIVVLAVVAFYLGKHAHEG